ncbi:MAG: short-chain dehydrogenase [Anaerolineaceae bacterium]|nr:short-chain dehydrogenase [Anaerolineaceae bacterium]
MKKKGLIGGLAALLAGIGIYKVVSSQNKENDPDDVWTTADMPDLTGKVIIVTGANSGIGFEAAKEFARKGAQTILACRSLEKAEAALDEIIAEIPNAPAEIMQLDLASLDSVRAFAAVFKAKYDRLDVLVNNAGIMMVPYGTTKDGFERQFGTNHLGHFALTGLLLDLILHTPGARVVNVSSNGHRMGVMDFDDLMYKDGEGYSATGAYGRSKLANLLFTYELQRRFDKLGIDALATAAHPGGTQTNLARHLEERWYVKLLGPLVMSLMQSADMGALPTIRAAVDPRATGGEYYGPGGFMEQRGYPVLVESSEASHNEADARRLWQISEQLTGVRYEELDRVAS